MTKELAKVYLEEQMTNVLAQMESIVSVFLLAPPVQLLWNSVSDLDSTLQSNELQKGT